MANAEGYVLPNPGIPKTMGILNVIFGVLGSLGGFCLVAGLLASPYLLKFAEDTTKKVQAQIETKKQADIKAYDDREKAATTDEEKAAIRTERDAMIASGPKFQNFDVNAVKDQIQNPTVMGLTALFYGTLFLLGVVLLVAGIGLIRLKGWGRGLSNVWGTAQILQLVVMTAVSIFYLQPLMRPNTEKMLAKLEADAKAPNAPPGAAETARFSRAMSSPEIANAFSLGFLVIGSIYPVILLIMINRPSARAALVAPKPRSSTEF